MSLLQDIPKIIYNAIWSDVIAKALCAVKRFNGMVSAAKFMAICLYLLYIID
jgi:hypothetical protein